MAEEFNPNAFRQQMAQQAGQIPAAVNPPQQPVAPQIQGQPQVQPYAPPAGQTYQPQQTPQQHVPQQDAPYQGQPQHAHPQHVHSQGAQQSMTPHPAQFQPPQQQFQPQLQQGYAQPPQSQGHQPGHYQGNQLLPEGEIQVPKAKRGLFKLKNLKAAGALNAPQMPQVPGQVSGQMDSALNAIPSADGVARPIVFVAGLALGVLGMTIGNMLFSGGDTPPIKAISSVSELTSEVPMSKMSEGVSEGKTKMMALTDEMLLDK